MWSVRQPHDATVEELLGDCLLCCPCQGVISRTSPELVVRESPASKGLNAKAERGMALEAVIRQRLVKTQQTEKSYYFL
jgi:hypothetical protein